MDKYDNLGVIGEGSYGVVIKCKHKQSGQVSSVILTSTAELVIISLNFII